VCCSHSPSYRPRLFFPSFYLSHNDTDTASAMATTQSATFIKQEQEEQEEVKELESPSKRKLFESLGTAMQSGSTQGKETVLALLDQLSKKRSLKRKHEAKQAKGKRKSRRRNHRHEDAKPKRKHRKLKKKKKKEEKKKSSKDHVSEQPIASFAPRNEQEEPTFHLQEVGLHDSWAFRVTNHVHRESENQRMMQFLSHCQHHQEDDHLFVQSPHSPSSHMVDLLHHPLPPPPPPHQRYCPYADLGWQPEATSTTPSCYSASPRHWNCY